MGELAGALRNNEGTSLPGGCFQVIHNLHFIRHSLDELSSHKTMRMTGCVSFQYLREIYMPIICRVQGFNVLSQGNGGNRSGRAEDYLSSVAVMRSEKRNPDV